MHKKHMILMLICCLIPVALLGGFFLFNLSIGTALLIGAFLICPVLHGIMFYLFLDNRRSRDAADHSSAIPSKKLFTSKLTQDR